MPRDFIDDTTLATGVAEAASGALSDAETRWRRFEALMRAEQAQAGGAPVDSTGAAAAPIAQTPRDRPRATAAPRPGTQGAATTASSAWRRRVEGALLGAVLAGGAVYLAGLAGATPVTAGKSTGLATAAPISVTLIAAPAAPRQTLPPRPVANVDVSAPRFQPGVITSAALVTAPATTPPQPESTTPAPVSDLVVGVPPEGGVPTQRPSPLRTALGDEASPTRL